MKKTISILLSISICLMMIVSIVPTSFAATKSLSISGTQLLDGDGNAVVLRGVNVPYAWYTYDSMTAISAIGNLGANCVRVVCSDGNSYSKTSYSELSNIINACKAQNMICVLEVHDYTGQDSTSVLTSNCVNYWKEMKTLLNANTDYVILNIANEWMGTWDNGSTWSNAYKTAIASFREAGINNVIMVDGPGYAQETAPLINYCQSILAADTTGNTMFSIHMYETAGASSSVVKSNINSMLNKGVCLCIGEFGCVQNGESVAYETIMSYCEEKSVGWIAWSWKGNASYNSALDMAYYWDGSSLSTWGDTVVNGTYGIKNTSVKPYGSSDPDTDSEEEILDGELIATLVCNESGWDKHTIGTVDFTNFTDISFSATCTETQYGFNKFYINGTEYWLNGNRTSLTGTLDGNDTSFGFANVSGQSNVEFAYEGNPTLTVKFYGTRTGEDTDSATDSESDTEIVDDELITTLYSNESGWDKHTLGTVDFTNYTNVRFVMTSTESVYGFNKFYINGTEYWLGGDLTSLSGTLDGNDTSFGFADVAGQIDVEFAYEGNPNLTISFYGTVKSADTETESETDNETVEGIVLYEGEGINAYGWEGSQVAELDNNFVAQEGGILRVTFVRGNNPEFKFAANNPSWNEILSAYFNQWDCINVTADTMEFTLSADDASAFVGESELWVVGDNVTISKVVYIPNGEIDTDTESDTETESDTDTNSETDTDTSTDTETDTDTNTESEGGIINGYYYVNGSIVKAAGVVLLDGDYYYIGMRGQVFKGTVSVTEAKANGLIPAGTYEFGENGKMIVQTSGSIINGYYYVNNEKVKGAGIVEIDNDLYYIGSKGQVFKGTIFVTDEKANGLLSAGTYVFGDDGKIIIQTGAQIIDGYYYVNNEKVKGAGIVEIDNNLYYIGSKGQVFKGTVYVTEEKTNSLISAGTYVFGEDGILVTDNGPKIVNGYYYVDNEIVKGAGIVEVDGNLYYIGMRGQVFKGTISVTEAKANGLIEPGIYDFNLEGIILD